MKPSDGLSEKYSQWLPLPRFLSGKGPKKAAVGSSMLTDRLYNRDLSWLHFNERVLSEADDSSVPLLERLKFASIVSSNLDEFFMVRVAEIERLASRPARYQYPDGMDAHALLTQIREQVLKQKARQSRVLHDIFVQLKKNGVDVLTRFENDPKIDRIMRSRLNQAQMILHRSDKQLPRLTSQKLYVFIRFPREYAIVDLGTRDDRLVEFPREGGVQRFALADRWIAARAHELFAKREVIEAFPFKILRDADISLDPQEGESLEAQVKKGLSRRPQDARVIRLEVDAPSYSEGALFLAMQFGISSVSLYRFDLPLDLRSLGPIYEISQRDRLRYPKVRPQIPTLLKKSDLFSRIRKGDILLHHPYDSFQVVIDFLEQAALDPDVTEIYHALYRTSTTSPIIEALKEAARRGKKVTAYIEIRARFDEQANVKWAQELRDAGVKVVRPLGGFKVHSKITRITRNEGGKKRVYIHLGTGNYHPETAKIYTDLGLFTTEASIGEETGRYFTAVTSRAQPAGFKELLVAPGNLHEKFLALIRQETRIQRGGGRGRIIAKMNSLVDPDIIDALYEASCAGVKIELMVRGICCLRPGIGGLSENIRVVSVIDRFLEHSRIYYFRAGGGEKIYLSSADWMPRNFYTRYEIAFPVKDAHLRRFIRSIVLRTGMQDNVKGWELRPDGSYRRVSPKPDEKPLRSQEFFQQLAKNRYRNTPLAARLTEK